MFTKLEGDSVLLSSKGVYHPCDLYTFNGALFAKTRGGYVRLRENGTTTKDGTNFTYLEYSGPLYADQFGRLTVVNGPKYKRLVIVNNVEPQQLAVA